MSKIKITCEAKEYLDFSEMAEFQGELKQRTDADFEKIENSIKKHGFAFPFFIWKNGDTNFVLDGHGRYGALQRMQSKGYEVGELPVVYVECKNKSDAKDLLLRINSVYGTMTKGSVLKFIAGDFSILKDDFQLPTGSIKFIEEFKKISFVNLPSEEVSNAENEEVQQGEPSGDIQFEEDEDGGFVDEAHQEYIENIEYQEPDYTEQAEPDTYLFKVGEIQFKSSQKEYHIFKDYLEQYAKTYSTTIGAINELFKRIA